MSYGKNRILVSLLIAGFLAAACGGGGGSGSNDGAPPPPPPSVGIPEATGSGVTSIPAPAGPFYKITDYGAVSDGAALVNQRAINSAITSAAEKGGGTVVIPSGDFKTCSIRLKSNVGLHFEADDAILRAAVHTTDGCLYDAPENNLFIGLQDHGHSHWANSLIYGIDIENVMISGPGLIDGSYFNTSGNVVNVLSGNDPGELTSRTATGVAAGANKAIALLRAHNIIMKDFRIKNGGHFAIIGTEVVNWTMDGLVIDTNRDALDVDSSQDVTIRNSVFNSLTDDAIVLKASFGGGRMFPLRNVLIEDCTVSGYDAGSVLAKTYTTNKIVATDQCGPTGRVKLGTEATTGFDQVTVRRVTFDRSRGFALESVDGAPLTNIIFENSTMKNVSSSPIFIRLGDRGRTPVTGNSATNEATSPTDNVRLDDRGWILPALTEKYGSYPAVRYIPSYARNVTVPIGGAMSGSGTAAVSIVNPITPTQLNAYSIAPTDPLFANAVGAGFATVKNIRINNIKITDVDPRYPILLAGLLDHPIENVTISNVDVEYRGGLKVLDSVEQRQLNRNITYTEYEHAPATQNVPFLVNRFFAVNEALLPRVTWNPTALAGLGAWENDPYNVPEMPRVYPDPGLFGILPSYGIYARHVKGLVVDNVNLKYLTEDERPPVVLDDVDDAKFQKFTATAKSGTPVFVTVTNTKKRDADMEYVLNYPYRATTVTNLVTPEGLAVEEVTVSRPAPGTPPDALYAFPTAPSAAYPYSFAVPSSTYPCPTTVFPGLDCR